MRLGFHKRVIIDNSSTVFLKLLCAGLWEKDVKILPYGEIDFPALLRLADEQSVVGLVAAGLEHVTDFTPTKKDVLQFIGQTVQMEQRNRAMNSFINVMVDKMIVQGINPVLVKGQGVAQCYERPLWRSSGDIDFFLSDENYKKAKTLLTPLASSVENEYVREKHLGMTINSWVVELHGRLYSGLSTRIEKELDDIYRDTFFRGNVRSWINDKAQMCLLKAENDAFYVFTHILQHFYKGGIGLRQICDWCRLLWKYRTELDLRELESRIRNSGLMSEWKAFGVFSVEYLEMPAEAMPFYSDSAKWKRKANKICSFILEVGNFGHNRDLSYFEEYPYVIRKTISFGYRMGDLYRHAQLFPLDSLRFFPRIFINGMRSAVRGE